MREPAARGASHPATKQAVAKSIVPLKEQAGLNGAEIVARAEKYVGKSEFNNRCEAFVEKMSGSPDFKGSAKQSYQDAVKNKTLMNTKDYSTIPAGARIYFTGNEKYGHTALSAGGGQMITTGIGGKIVKMPIADLSKQWGRKGTFLGYSTKYGNKSLSLAPERKAPHQAAPLEGAPKPAKTTKTITALPLTPDKTDNTTLAESTTPTLGSVVASPMSASKQFSGYSPFGNARIY